MNPKENCVIRVLCILAVLSETFATPTTITAPPFSDNIISDDKDNMKYLFGRCLHKKDVAKCLKKCVISTLDDVIQNEDPLSVNLFNLNVSLNKNPQFAEVDNVIDTNRAFEDIISQKLKTLIESRVIQVRLAEDVRENLEATLNVNEARKKKAGGKHGGMMMGGLALTAFLAQIFMSKVAFMSGAALILAKIALLFSALTNLKKSSGSGHGEHVVYASADKQGWQRSMHTLQQQQAVLQNQQNLGEDLAYRGHPALPSYDGV